MEEYGDIYFIDDPRNAVVMNRGPRVGQGGRPRTMTTVRPRHPAQSYGAPSYPQPYPQGYAPAPAPVMYASPQPYYSAPQYFAPNVPPYVGDAPAQSTAASILGRLTTGQIIEMVAQAFAAMQPLPNEPDTDAGAYSEGAAMQDLITYQTALAQHAKRDEQIRTVAGLASKLLG